MTRAIDKRFFEWLKSASGNVLLRTVSQYSSLSINLAGTALKVYFDGMLILTIPDIIADNEHIKLIPLSVGYAYNEECRLKSIIEGGVCLNNLQDYLDAAIGFLSRRNNKRQEERIRQAIAYENNRSPYANDTDYFVVAQEYAVIDADSAKTSKFDLVTVRWPSTSSCRRRFSSADVEIVVFELKLGLGAVGGSSASRGKKADLKCHIADFKNGILNDAARREEFKYDILQMFVQQAALPGFYSEDVKGLKHVCNLKSDTEVREFAAQIDVRFGFILANYKSASSLLAEQLAMFDDDFLFATGSYMGYGLYDSSMLTRKTLLNHLK
ncbi:MAG: hypothetical protein NC301_05745 [Bacteroides sp.]|nr:hypothetical protein [Bacteroides sp.]MCM1379224.1 hypothetical protein [Bacteroides sp.]MCM1445118.1 hypothetical protein [Prevotella sp.]